MDDVGQTLLNWASAFGTLEMVEFLCHKGADVNRGQRSSSLHYAACFGRPAVAKVSTFDTLKYLHWSVIQNFVLNHYNIVYLELGLVYFECKTIIIR